MQFLSIQQNINLWIKKEIIPRWNRKHNPDDRLQLFGNIWCPNFSFDPWWLYVYTDL